MRYIFPPILFVCVSQPSNQKAFVCIVKVPYESGMGHDLLTQLDVYRKELDIYEIILPKLKAQLMQSGIDADIVADTIHVCHKHKSIVFEDLSLRGYRMPARCDGLDMAHTKILLRQLAVFHATCALLHEKDENIYTNFKHGKNPRRIPLYKHIPNPFFYDFAGMFNRNDAAFQIFYTTSFDALTAQISTWPAFDGYVAKLKRIRPQLMERGRRSFDPIPGQFNTLIHGDIWVNNTMYTYDANGQPDRIMLVDFQFCCWASPTVDLHYFFNTSVRPELRLHHQTEMVQHYHEALVDTLTRLKFRGTIPTLGSLQRDFMRTSFYGWCPRKSFVRFWAGALLDAYII